MAVVIYPFISFIILGIAIVIITLILISTTRRKEQGSKRFHSARQRYVSGQFSEQMELDLRLPYRRFKQLYPGTRWTYEEYKRIQMQRAFRRSTSSQDNKRMVR